jgi:OOP family OmpA-OmpF porin/outer membrane immunogenic protein
LILVSCLALAGFSMSAGAAELTGGYIRGELGNSNVDVGSDSDSDNTWGVGGGWWFNKNFAVEGSWNSLYDEDGVSLDGFGVGLVGKTTVADGKGFYADGRIGMFRAKGEVDGFGSDTSTDLYFGVGVGYDFNQNVGVGLNYTRYNGDFDGLDADTSTLTGSLEFRF